MNSQLRIESLNRIKGLTGLEMGNPALTHQYCVVLLLLCSFCNYFNTWRFFQNKKKM